MDTMTATLFTYCRAWNWKLWKPGEVISEEEARRRYSSGNEDEWFSVAAFAAEDQEIPSFVLEVTPHGTTIRTKFYNTSRSQRSEYVFDVQPDGRMFMTEAVEWTYPDDETHYRLGKANLIEHFKFSPDGIVERTIDLKSEPEISKVSYRDVDVSGNWEAAPSFGDWARFGDEQR